MGCDGDAFEGMLYATLGAMSVAILPYLYILLVVPWTEYGGAEFVIGEARKLILKIKEKIHLE